MKAIDELKSVISEAKKHPSQYDAEYMAELTNSIGALSTAGTSKETQSLHSKIDGLRMKLWDKIFGDSSPWKSVDKKGKRVVEWDKAKADKLGL